jgi:hypothetical protein
MTQPYRVMYDVFRAWETIRRNHNLTSVQPSQFHRGGCARLHATTSGVLFLPDLIFGLLSDNPAAFMLVWQTAFQLGRI